MFLLPTLKYKLRVICMTYNHSQYIEDTMNGFCMQKTSFPFVAIIVDDASTDGEPEIIRKYLEDHFDMATARNNETGDAKYTAAIHKENHNCHFFVILLKYNFYRLKKAKYPLYKGWYEHVSYIAHCEGDDHWIDSGKLQRQVDFLEANPDYIMCCSDAKIKTPIGEHDWHRYDKDTEVPVKDIILGGGLFIQTCTICYRTELKRMPPCCLNCHVGDYPLQIWASLNGKVYYFADKMATYNIGVPGSWSSRQRTESIEKSAKGWRSEVDMLQGLDAYSNGKFHKYFKQRTIEYVYSILSNHIVKWPSFCTLFDDVIKEFVFSQKIVEKLARWRFKNMATSVALMLEREYKSAFVSLPLVNDVYRKWKGQ